MLFQVHIPFFPSLSTKRKIKAFFLSFLTFQACVKRGVLTLLKSVNQSYYVYSLTDRAPIRLSRESQQSTGPFTIIHPSCCRLQNRSVARSQEPNKEYCHQLQSIMVELGYSLCPGPPKQQRVNLISSDLIVILSSLRMLTQFSSWILTADEYLVTISNSLSHIKKGVGITYTLNHRHIRNNSHCSFNTTSISHKLYSVVLFLCYFLPQICTFLFLKNLCFCKFSIAKIRSVSANLNSRIKNDQKLCGQVFQIAHRYYKPEEGQATAMQKGTVRT